MKKMNFIMALVFAFTLGFTFSSFESFAKQERIVPLNVSINHSDLKKLKRKHKGKRSGQITQADIFEWARLKMRQELKLKR